MSLKLPRNWDFNLRMDMSKIVRSQSMMAVDPKGSGSWSQAPNPLERPLKAGWLKKQRSLVRNWQQRYFVLRGQHLYYYKDEEDLKSQVTGGWEVTSLGQMNAHASPLPVPGLEVGQRQWALKKALKIYSLIPQTAVFIVPSHAGRG
uniref:Rho GTPase activating protein 25 n=1 Tax=Varanus komodoensis TaxID=61221 RepID=A0A8D2LGY1_VARKO